MPDLIEPAKSGRARCRGCGEKIEKGALRFGEAVPNAFGDEGSETTHWFHLGCAADRRPDKLGPALAAFEGEVPEREPIDALLALGARNPELSRVRRAERAPSGRARCRECREFIEKDALRVVIEEEGETPGMPTRYYVHAGCAAAHVGAEGLLEKLGRTSAGLGDEDHRELEQAMSGV